MFFFSSTILRVTGNAVFSFSFTTRTAHFGCESVILVTHPAEAPLADVLFCLFPYTLVKVSYYFGFYLLNQRLGNEIDVSHFGLHSPDKRLRDHANTIDHPIQAGSETDSTPKNPVRSDELMTENQDVESSVSTQNIIEEASNAQDCEPCVY